VALRLDSDGPAVAHAYFLFGISRQSDEGVIDRLSARRLSETGGDPEECLSARFGMN
jgi:hypothetical protein